MLTSNRDSVPVLRCSFCGKSQSDVAKLIAGPTAFICDECVQICTEIIQAEKDADVPAPEPESPALSSLHSTLVVTCGLCGQRLPWADGLLIPQRGMLCPGCIGEIEAQLAERSEDGA